MLHLPMENKITYTRNDSLDALRGISILLMILSGSIAFGGVLPAWMYHAQVPPPTHKFNPEIPGITWVDLVFPFFLFSMGVAIPLALGKWEGKANATANVWWIAARRFLLLTWFALFTFHMRAWVIAENPGTPDYLLSIGAFVLLFFELYKPREGGNHTKLFTGLQVGAYAISAFLLYYLPFNKGAGFLLEKSDIIIIVLGNMAFFGTVVWWHTRNHPWLRIGLLPFVMAIFLGGKVEGSWNEMVFNWSPAPWMYTFYYLKYLFIIIPGTLAGEYMIKQNYDNLPVQTQQAAGWLLFVLLLINVTLLFNRMLLLNLFITAGIIVWVFYLLRKYKTSLLFSLFMMGSYLLMLGLFFEAWEGGIKKDSSTYSYYFVTAGLASYLLVFFYSLQTTPIGKKMNSYLATNGQNPMVAYVAGNLLLAPVLHITGLISFMNNLNADPFTGFMKGVIFTGIVSLITFGFTRKKWFWKT
jgi:predicted acyltransferase